MIPLGTRAYIVGYGFATAEDTGGAINGVSGNLASHGYRYGNGYGYGYGGYSYGYGHYGYGSSKSDSE